MRRNRSSWIDHRIGSKAYKIANNRTKLSSSSIDECSFRKSVDICIIVSPVCRNHSRCKIYIISRNGIDDNGSLGNHSVVPEITAFNFRE